LPRRAAACLLLALAMRAGGVSAQAPRIPLPGPPRHYLHHIGMTPGEVGRQQLIQGRQMGGYFQPVEVRGPAGSLVSVAIDNTFSEPQSEKVKAGLLIGQVYRFKIGAIPLLEGREVFPTVEVINRLYPPPGMAARFPIPIELTREELEMAMSGRLVTRVIYLEDPSRALPILQNEEQRYFEIEGHLDPLQFADRLGRPMAILRMGSRVPLDGSDDFHFGGPPVQLFPEIAEIEQAPPAPVTTRLPGARPQAATAMPTPAGAAVRPATASPAADPTRPAAHAAPSQRYPRLPTRYDLPRAVSPRSTPPRAMGPDQGR
jgi:hypothetical protein